MKILTTRKMFALAGLLSLAAASTALSSELKDSGVVPIHAEVLYVDHDARQIHVMEVEGGGSDREDPVATSNWLFRSFTVADDVEVFDYVRAGDKVTLEVDSNISVDIRKPTKEELEKPFLSYTVTEKDGVLEHVIKAVCVIEKVDKKDDTLTFRGPGGRMFRIHVMPGEMPRDAKVGQEFVATYGQGAVVGIKRAG